MAEVDLAFSLPAVKRTVLIIFDFSIIFSESWRAVLKLWVVML